MELFDLKGKTAVVTGAARGIGKATAALLEKAGATVARIDIDAAPGIISADVADEEALERAFKKVGAVDILVNNAGIAVRKNALDITREAWDRVIAVNVSGVFLCSRIAARTMKERGGGAIVNLASIMGFSGGIFPNPAYQTSKGAVVNMTRALAAEWGQYNITVNAIAPGFFPSKMTQWILGQIGDTAIAQTPLARLGGEDDLKGLAALFASDASAHITGQIVAVDGGASII